jgi:predicted nucleic acid-binding protein
MNQRYPILIYADTSVYGGVFDDEFNEASSAFFDAVKAGGFSLVVSEVVQRELAYAPAQVVDFFQSILPQTYLTPVSQEAIDLQQSYIQEGVVTAKSLDDALHVALASVAGCDIIVSWNFKHIVNFRRIPLFNAVNTLKGYKPISIYSPLEVVSDEK